MRNIILALMRIKDDFINQKLMMTLYSIGSVICILVFMYFYVNIPALFEQYEQYSVSERTYMISLEEETEIKRSDFDVLDGYRIEEIKVQAYEYAGENVYINDYDVLSEDYTPVKSNKIFIVLKSTLSFNDNAGFISDISENLGKIYNISEIGDPLVGERDENSQKAAEVFRQIVNVSLTYMICFIACAYLFKYVFDSNRYENTIYSLIGASKRRVVCIMLIEAGVLSLASSLIAITIHVLLYDSLFVQINTEGVVYDVLDYLVIAAFTLVLSIITIIPFFITYLRNPIIKTKRECV